MYNQGNYQQGQPPPSRFQQGSLPHPQNSNWSQSQLISPPVHHLTPPPHQQGQHFYRLPGPPLQAAVAALPLAPPSTSSYFTPTPFELSLIRLPPPPPPLLPPSSSPPPLPPSSPEFNNITDIPPPRPKDEETVRKIEVLCQYIAKNGNEFGNMVLQKQVDNPEYEFLYGGAPGSEAAISHEYFKWMKKKCSASELREGGRDTDASFKPSGVESSMQRDVSHSPAGSDMDMEDDITQPEEQDIGKSFGSTKHDHAFISDEVDIKVEENVKDGNVFCSESSGVNQQDSKTEELNIKLPQEMNQSDASATAKPSSSEAPAEPNRGTSPFKLIQSYASDNSSENELHFENLSPVAISPQFKDETPTLHDLQTHIESKKSPEIEKVPEPSRRTEDLEKKGYSHRVREQVDDPKSGGAQKEDGKSKLDVDEFGRKVKAGGSDSDNDNYRRRRSKRGGSRSRSRSRSSSPNGRRRRRSPRRRRDRRSRSRSRSPKNRNRNRSRSRSPYRRGGETGGDWSRRNKNNATICHDFRRGKCFRGESCRYFHEEKNNESRHYKNKHQNQEVSDKFRNSDKFTSEKDEIDSQEIQQLYQDVNITSHKEKEELLEPSADVASGHAPLDVTSSNQLQQTGEQLATEYNVMPMSNYPPYQPPPYSLHPHSSLPLPSTWNQLPPPPPPPLGGPLPPYQLNQLQPPLQVNHPFFVRPDMVGPTFQQPRISNPYNPYASTFDQPPYSNNHGPSLGQTQPQTNQYDPLFDSIDLSINKTDDRHIENDEFGETADAEVGAVENDSPSSPIDLADVATGEIEIDQVKSSSKTKSKDSRSMKLFKVALADFVKEVLKPSWRQGNMSKEAFKTIVKKTVDKVSGAMKKHQLPKSQAKINHYIDSSQRKLTKLVMGYVDKYVKV